MLDEDLVGDTSQAKAVGLVGVPDGELRQALASLVCIPDVRLRHRVG